MASSAVQRTSLSWDARSNGEIRLEDYLNDKLQTYADLESIDVLLRNVVDQQNILRQQVCIFLRRDRLLLMTSIA